MALGVFHNYLYFNPLSSLMGNNGQTIVVRLWVQKTKRKALKLNEFWRFLYFLLEHYWNFFLHVSQCFCSHTKFKRSNSTTLSS